MKYDVFISYSHADSVAALQLEQKLYLFYGLNCFRYDTDISGGENYLKEISDAVIESTVFIFIGSADSYISKYTIKELCFAVDIKVNQSDIIIFEKVGDPVPPFISLLTKGCQSSSWDKNNWTDLNSLLKATSLKVLNPITYNEGVVYNLNGVETLCLGGSQGAGHFIALKEKQAPWCLPNELYSREMIGSIDDGTDNYLCAQYFRKYPMCKKFFPAFAICEEIGKGWSLPIKDFFDFFTYEGGYQSTWDDINQYLKKYSSINPEIMPLQQPGSDAFYWTGTEVNATHAYGFSMKDMCLHEYEKTNPNGYVRAFLFYFPV